MTNQGSGGPPPAPCDDPVDGFPFDTDPSFDWDLYFQQSQTEHTGEQWEQPVGAQPLQVVDMSSRT
jgi:hypothetical protein